MFFIVITGIFQKDIYDLLQFRRSDDILNAAIIKCTSHKTRYSRKAFIQGSFNLFFLPYPPFSGAAPSSTAYLWWSTRSTARVHPVSTRRPSGETPPGIGCPQLRGNLYPGARPLRAPTACSASRSSNSTKQLSREAPPSIGSYQMGPGKLSLLCALLSGPECYIPYKGLKTAVETYSW